MSRAERSVPRQNEVVDADSYLLTFDATEADVEVRPGRPSPGRVIAEGDTRLFQTMCTLGTDQVAGERCSPMNRGSSVIAAE
jgi:hypothetical protein